MFSACEYLIAVANIVFHFTAVIEFGRASWCLVDCDVYSAACDDGRLSVPLPSNGPHWSTSRMMMMSRRTDCDARTTSKKLS